MLNRLFQKLSAKQTTTSTTIDTLSDQSSAETEETLSDLQESNNKTMSTEAEAPTPTATTTTNTVTNTATTPTPEVAESPVEEQPNVTQQVYEKVKDVWTFGKTLPVVGICEGIAESLAGKVLGAVAGKSLQDLDEHLKPTLADLDKGVVNPAIDAVVKAVMEGVSKGEDVIKPFALAVLGLVGFAPQIEDEAGQKTQENDSIFAVPPPEVTPIVEAS